MSQCPNDNESEQIQEIQKSTIEGSEVLLTQAKDSVVASAQGGGTVHQTVYQVIQKNFRQFVVYRLSRSDIKVALIASIFITGLVFSSRWQGVIQDQELIAFDRTMQQQQTFEYLMLPFNHFIQRQPVSIPDSRLLIIRVTQEDLKTLRQPTIETSNGARTLSDATLDKLLEKLDKYQPRTIGLDLFSVGEVNQIYKHLKSDLSSGRLISTCAGGSSESGQLAKSAPTDSLKDNIGFADLVFDQDRVIRRHLLLMGLSNQLICKSFEVEAFSLKLALNYLRNLGITRQDIGDEDALKLGHLKLMPLKLHTGGYHKPDSDVEGGIQIIMNYRPYQNYLDDIAKVFSITDILKTEVDATFIKDKIILIGADDLEDRHQTPYSSGQASRAIPGVFIHAQMVSHILDLAERKRPLIWVLDWWIDLIWIWLWSLIGGLLIFWAQRQNFLSTFLMLALLNLGTLSALHGLCLSFLTLMGLWMPLFPSKVVLLTTNISMLLHLTLKMWRLK